MEEPTIDSTSSSSSSSTKQATHDALSENDDDEEEEYAHLFQSIRSPTGLELGVRVTWPGTTPMELSTCLPSEEIAPMFHGTQWAGTRVWKAAVVALQYLLEEQSPLKEILNKATPSSFSCLELGCGLGLPAMLLHRFHPDSHVVLTDCESLLPQLQQNLTNNFTNTQHLQAATLDWESDEDLANLLVNCGLSAFDVVLTCDCIYEPLYGESWKSLLKVQIKCLEANPNALVLTSLERRKFDGADRYLAALREHPLIAKVALVHEEDPVEIYRIYAHSPTNAKKMDNT